MTRQKNERFFPVVPFLNNSICAIICFKWKSNPFFLTVKIDFTWFFYLGLGCYLAGLCLCTAAVVSFSMPDENGLNTNGIYRFSRNPMYVAYFVCFTGMACLTRSWILLGLTLVFQISGHWIILSEERWCAEKFGDAYEQYRRRVRRYI